MAILSGSALSPYLLRYKFNASLKQLKASLEADDFNDQVFKIFINNDVFKSIVENGYDISFKVLTPVIGNNTYYINKTVEEQEDLLKFYNNIKF